MRHRSSAQTPAKPRLDARLLARMLPYLAQHRGRIALSVVLLVSAKAATVALPLLLKHLVDTLAAGTGAAVAVPIGLLAGYGVLRLGSSWFRELQSLIFNEASNGIVRTMSREVLAHLHELSLRFHLERHTGAVTRDIERGTSSVANLLAYLLFNIVPTLVELVLIAFVLFVSYSAGFVAVTVATFALYVGFTLTMTQWRVAFRTAANAAESRASSQAIDSLLNFETVKYFGNEGYEVERYDGSLAEWQRAATKSQASLAALNAGQALIITAGVTGLMFLAADAVAARAMTVGDLVAVNAYLLQLFIPLGFLGSIYSAMRQAHVDMERMFELLERVPEVRDAAGAPALTPGAGELRFEDVLFSYDPARPILRGVSFVVPAGKKVAIVGPSGAGKSTIARLLFRLYDVTGGSVRIDGADVREVTLASVRAAIGVVPQDTVLFHDTLRANIAYGRRGATDDEVLRALGLADLERFVASLPQGLDTIVGERGLKLSGGEKQRVAIARALLKAPRVLVFDEATSSLDSASEQAILSAMRQVAHGHTTLVIAHRLSTVIDADEILVLDEGVIRERGTHATLLAAGGAYARLWQLQREQGDTPHAAQRAANAV